MTGSDISTDLREVDFLVAEAIREMGSWVVKMGCWEVLVVRAVTAVAKPSVQTVRESVERLRKAGIVREDTWPVVELCGTWVKYVRRESYCFKVDPVDADVVLLDYEVLQHERDARGLGLFSEQPTFVAYTARGEGLFDEQSTLVSAR